VYTVKTLLGNVVHSLLWQRCKHFHRQHCKQIPQPCSRDMFTELPSIGQGTCSQRCLDDVVPALPRRCGSSIAWGCIHSVAQVMCLPCRPCVGLFIAAFQRCVYKLVWGCFTNLPKGCGFSIAQGMSAYNVAHRTGLPCCPRAVFTALPHGCISNDS
jgi:hypothetical protein